METPSSCIPGEPLTKLDADGKASILNYNLPQATSYDVVSFIKLDVRRSQFKNREKQVPKDNYWSQIEAEQNSDRFTVDSITNVVTGKSYSPIAELQNVALNLNSSSAITRSGLVVKSANIPLATKTVPFSDDYIANKIAEGYMPKLYKRFSGKQGLTFVKKPPQVRPSIYMVMHMRMSSFLGDYGAGQTLSTFSLLPGEVTTISLRSYQHDEETRRSSESVLDSYSESATEDLQTIVEESTQQSESSSETDTDSMSADLSVSGGVNLGIVNLGADASGSASSVNTTTEAMESQVNTLTSAVDHHVQTADTQRQIEVNTESTTTSISETEKTTTRTLENINRSRVLNFVFRQLLQEYFTITYLHDVTFVYHNGYSSSKKTAKLASFENLLREVLRDREAVRRVSNQIFEQLCNINDYEGSKTSFIELVKDQQKNCIRPSEGGKAFSYIRKRRELAQTYRDKTVPGIILDVTHRILRTPSVIVDALLGQGEANDCFNMQLQDATIADAQLTNRKVEQAIGIIDAIEDPVEKAANYQKVFSEPPKSEDETATA